VDAFSSSVSSSSSSSLDREQETPMSASKASSGKNVPAVPLHEANLRIARLYRQHIETARVPEDLDRPLDPGFEVTGDERAHRLTLKVGDVGVSWCAAVDFQQQIGTSLVRMAGLADVGTHNEHRFKGYSRQVMINYLRWCRQAGYDVVMLYGISGFYPKFGWAESFPAITHSILVRDAELALPSKIRFVDFDEAKHLRAVLKMYHANNAGRTGPTLREEGKWHLFRKGNPWGPRPVVKVGLDAAGKPVCYFAYDAAPNVDASILEACYASPAAFGSLLRETAALAWNSRVEKVNFQMPEDDAFMGFCRQFGMRKEVHYRRDGGAMVRMINIPSALAKAGPVLAARISSAKAGSLTIRTNLDDVDLSWGRGGGFRVQGVTGRRPQTRPIAMGRLSGKRKGSSDTVRLPQWALAQLFFGYQSVDALVTSGALAGSKAGLESLARLFPQGPHFHYRVDCF
jgi:predicted acetyltransferase